MQPSQPFPLPRIARPSAAVLSAALIAGSVASAWTQVYPTAPPTDPLSAGTQGPRLQSLGEPRFSDPSTYNLYDQGGSPMGLLETRKERLGLGLAYASVNRATPGDSLEIGRSDVSAPRLGFFQPGVFGATLYFLRESDSYEHTGTPAVDGAYNRFGLDFAAGPSSGLFRVGFSAHGRLGNIDYGVGGKRVLVSVPSLRFDLGSRLHPMVEAGLFAGMGARFDSLESANGDLERVAAMDLPRWGVLADIGGTEDLPLMGNVVIELGTERSLGEYRPAGDSGYVYPTLLTGHWSFQTQWLYPVEAGDFLLQPALRFAHRSESAQGYEGQKGNQDPLKKGPEIPGLDWTRSITAFGLGGQATFAQMTSLLMEWETSGHAVEADSAREERYHRFSIGLEHHVHRMDFDFPEGLGLTLRAGWQYRQEAEAHPGFRDYHLNPFLPSPAVGARGASAVGLAPSKPAALSAFTLGFGFGLLEERVGLEGYAAFPGQNEIRGAGTEEASGTEFGITAIYRIL